MSEATATCERCGRTFAVPAWMRERYPGWAPDRCPSCYADGQSATGSRRSAGGGGTRRRADTERGGRSRRGTADENLTTAEILDKYSGGPTSGVFTDGSAIPNPGPGGWGAVYVVDGEVVDQAHGHDPATTNNRMELTALVHGCDLVPPGTPATVYTDSRLAVDTITKWAAGWKRRGWRRKTGEVLNLDLVKELYTRFEARPELTLEWIAAHAGCRWNEYADSLSTAWLRDEV
ncbi:MAG: ribonuclease H family protein [Nitriliruptorales bacterium]